MAEQHQWLQKLLGEWTATMTASMGPGQPDMQSKGTDSVRQFGENWIVAEGTGETPDGGIAYNLMTLGYDPAKGKFVGTFVSTCMTNLWVYEGQLNKAGTTLTLDTEGPSMTGESGSAKYQDIIEIVSDDERTLRSQVLLPDGQWQNFMTATYRRKA